MASQMDGPMGEESDMWELTISQPLPKRGERAADRARARAVADMARADVAAMAGEMAAETAMALAEAEGAERRLKLLRAQVERLGAVLSALNVRLSTGSNGRLAERLTVQTRLAAMELMIQEETRMAEDALAAARGRLGLAPEAALPRFAAPDPDAIRGGLAPATLVAQARAREADAMVGMARASARPMTALGLRLERERSRMGNEDIVGLAFMSEIPWLSRGYARAEAQAAEAERAAAQSDAAAVSHRVAASLSRAARAQRLAETARRLSTETLSRLRAEYDAMLGTAGVAAMGQSTVLEVVELLEKETDAETQVIAAETASRVAAAELWRFAPAALFQLQTKDTP
jgi:outer membrane protein TolC